MGNLGNLTILKIAHVFIHTLRIFQIPKFPILPHLWNLQTSTSHGLCRAEALAKADHCAERYGQQRNPNLNMGSTILSIICGCSILVFGYGLSQPIFDELRNDGAVVIARRATLDKATHSKYGIIDSHYYMWMFHPMVLMWIVFALLNYLQEKRFCDVLLDTSYMRSLLPP